MKRALLLLFVTCDQSGALFLLFFSFFETTQFRRRKRKEITKPLKKGVRERVSLRPHPLPARPFSM